MMFKYLKWIILPIFLLLITSCAGWRPATVIEAPQAPDNYLRTETINPHVDEAWWSSFEDTTLNRIMGEMFANNLSLEQAAARLDRLRSTHAASNSSWLPSIGLRGNLQDNGNLTEKDVKTTGATLPTYDIKLTASYEIDLWGKLAARRSAARSDLIAGEEDLQAIIQSLSAQVARAYFTLRELQFQLVLYDKIILSNRAYLDLVSQRYERGIVSALDVYQAEIALSSAIGRRQLTQARFEAAEHAISILLGRYPEEINFMTSDSPLHGETGVRTGELLIPEIPKEIKDNLFFTDEITIGAGIPSELIQRRPDIRAAFRRMQSADKRWAEATASRLPSFNLTGQLGGSSNELKTALDPDAWVWNAIGGLVVPLFEGGRLKANAEAAQSSFNETAAKYKETVLNAFREVEDALSSLDYQDTYVSELKKQQLTSARLLEIATDQYLRGITDYLRVVNAQTAFFNASSSLITARKGLVDDYISLATALGGSWSNEFENSIRGN